MTERIVMEVRQIGPSAYAGFACAGLYGTIGSSRTDVVDRLRPQLPLEIRNREVHIKDLPVHVPG